MLASEIHIPCFTLGMVSVAGGCDSFAPWTSCLVASIACTLHLVMSGIMVKLRIDDPVDAVAVHFASGEF